MFLAGVYYLFIFLFQGATAYGMGMMAAGVFGALGAYLLWEDGLKPWLGLDVGTEDD